MDPLGPKVAYFIQKSSKPSVLWPKNYIQLNLFLDLLVNEMLVLIYKLELEYCFDQTFPELSGTIHW